MRQWCSSVSLPALGKWGICFGIYAWNRTHPRRLWSMVRICALKNCWSSLSLCVSSVCLVLVNLPLVNLPLVNLPPPPPTSSIAVIGLHVSGLWRRCRSAVKQPPTTSGLSSSMLGFVDSLIVCWMTSAMGGRIWSGFSAHSLTTGCLTRPFLIKKALICPQCVFEDFYREDFAERTANLDNTLRVGVCLGRRMLCLGSTKESKACSV